MALATVASMPPSLFLITAPKSISFSISNLANPTLPETSSALLRRRRVVGKVQGQRSQVWRICAGTGDALPSEAAIEKAQQLIPPSTEDGAVSSIVGALLAIAFVSLSILTIGVIYLAVQDFLQKRERDKFEKEESENKKKGGKKKKVKARAGPRGFGQKIEEEDD
ncbi:uncharacterized protein [Typha angustifolia]|uniref:uncharacterized protein n=1 Tax=Typha angustifolia TaxID=59011 RepID=UPI003C2D3DDB